MSEVIVPVKNFFFALSGDSDSFDDFFEVQAWLRASLRDSLYALADL